MDRQAWRSGEAVAVYVHVPWCLVKCPYCDFNVVAARRWPEERYTRALARELAHRAGEPPFAGATVASVYFGGGTPSLFAPRSIAATIEAIRARLDLRADCEITLEANPETVDARLLRELRVAGVNRLSLGVQSFRPELLRVLGRRHGPAQCRAVVRAVRAAGFDNLSLDLIYAVPGQDLAACTADLDDAIALAPEHVSAYCLTYEEGTPLTRARALGRLSSVDEELEAEMLERVAERLGKAGYRHYEVSSHARPGFESRHNRAYWRGLPYIGLGAGAHSFVPARGEGASWGERWENARDPADYVARVDATGSAVGVRETLTRAQAVTEFCWLGLRERRGIDPEEFESRFGEPLRRVFPQVAELELDGLLEWRRRRLALTAAGLRLADEVFARFVA